MRIKCAYVENYKSISKEQKIFFNDRIAVIIGKNESGKTNILDLFSDISLMNGIRANINSKKTVLHEEEEFKAKLELEYTISEVKKLKLQSGIAYFKLSDTFSNYCEIDGCVRNYFETDEFKEYIDEFKTLTSDAYKIIKDNSMRNQITEVKKYCSNFHIQTKPYYRLKIESLDKSFIDSPELNQKWDNLKEKLLSYIGNIYSTFPIFHKVNNYEFKTTYTMGADFFSKKTGSDKAIENLISATNLPQSDWEYASYKMPGSQREHNSKERIRESIGKISIEFSEYFGLSSNIIIKPDFSYSKFNLFVQSNDQFSVPLSERSQGLRWYFNLFLEMKNLDLLNRNVVILIDEPGVHLHVNAQKEVLRMFDNFGGNQNQIIYSTHSPYMIDEDKIYRVIPVHKSEDDSTIISTSISSDSISAISKLDTLTPLIEAIGMKLKYNIGFVDGYKYIVTEGITDATYLNNFINYFDKERYRAVPSKSATNVYLMCLLLYGFGFDNFIALFDWDKEGKRSANVVIKTFANALVGATSEEVKNKYIRFINNDDDVENFIIEDLIEEDVLQFESVTASKRDKVLFCHTFCRILNEKPNEISSMTKANFKNLIDTFN